VHYTTAIYFFFYKTARKGMQEKEKGKRKEKTKRNEKKTKQNE
jgi:hypothetical protein